MLWACQITTAKISWGLPKSICTHCVPFRRKMMLWSDASLSPSASLSRLSAGTFLSLHVILLAGARFFRRGGTIIGGAGPVRKPLDVGAEFQVCWDALEGRGGQVQDERHRTVLVAHDWHAPWPDDPVELDAYIVAGLDHPQGSFRRGRINLERCHFEGCGA